MIKTIVAASIIGLAIIIAASLQTYFSPFQTCMRLMHVDGMGPDKYDDIGALTRCYALVPAR